MSRKSTDRMTVYVDAEEVQRRIKELELEHDEALEANKGDIHQAMMNVALADEEALVEEIRHVAGDDE